MSLWRSKSRVMHRVGESRLKPIVWRARQLRGRMVARLMAPVEESRLRRLSPLRLNVGCGAARFPGWVNIDIIPGADLALDVTKGLPFDGGSVDLIYNEHFMEHLTIEDAENVLRDFKRCLKMGGILRIAMPDLDALVESYRREWKDQDWLTVGSKVYCAEYEFIKSRGRMLNWSFYGRPMFSSSHRDPYGHKYLYNEEDLRSLLLRAGFKRIVRCERNQSSCKDLCNLETRVDSKLVMEAHVE